MFIKRAGLIAMLIGTVYFLHADPVLKKRSSAGKRNTTDLKQAIATELKELLTLSTTLIRSATDTVDMVVEKAQDLASGDDDYFATQNAAHLEHYKKRLETARKTVAHSVEIIEQELALLTNNFVKE